MLQCFASVFFRPWNFSAGRLSEGSAAPNAWNTRLQQRQQVGLFFPPLVFFSAQLQVDFTLAGPRTKGRAGVSWWIRRWDSALYPTSSLHPSLQDARLFFFPDDVTLLLHTGPRFILAAHEKVTFSSNKSARWWYPANGGILLLWGPGSRFHRGGSARRDVAQLFPRADGQR